MTEAVIVTQLQVQDWHLNRTMRIRYRLVVVQKPLHTQILKIDAPVSCLHQCRVKITEISSLRFNNTTRTENRHSHFHQRTIIGYLHLLEHGFSQRHLPWSINEKISQLRAKSIRNSRSNLRKLRNSRWHSTRE